MPFIMIFLLIYQISLLIYAPSPTRLKCLLGQDKSPHPQFLLPGQDAAQTTFNCSSHYSNPLQNSYDVINCKDLWSRFAGFSLMALQTSPYGGCWNQLTPLLLLCLFKYCRHSPRPPQPPLTPPIQPKNTMADRSPFFNVQTSCIFAKLIHQKHPQRKHLKRIITEAMTTLGIDSLKADYLGKNTYRLEFGTVPLARDIMEASPWVFLKSPLLLTPEDPEATLDEHDFTKIPFWVQIYGLPTGRLTPDEVVRLGAHIGEVCQPETRAANTGNWRRFLRVRVLLDAAQPLIPGFFLRRQDREPIWLNLKYERLQDFCYQCGRLSHLENSCRFPGRIRVEDEEKNLGGHMRTTPWNSFQPINPSTTNRPDTPTQPATRRSRNQAQTQTPQETEVPYNAAPNAATIPTVDIFTDRHQAAAVGAEFEANQDRLILETLQAIQSDAAQIGRPMEEDPRYRAIQEAALSIWIARAQNAGPYSHQEQPQFDSSTGGLQHPLRAGHVYQAQSSHHSMQPSQRQEYYWADASRPTQHTNSFNFADYTVEFPDTDSDGEENRQPQLQSITDSHTTVQNDGPSLTWIAEDEISTTLDRLTLKRTADDVAKELMQHHKRPRIDFLPGSSYSRPDYIWTEEVPQGPPLEP